MIFSEKKLRELANIDNNVSSNKIIEAINSIGFEVESVQTLNKVEGLKFGHVLAVAKNPNSNKLNVCKIKFNDKERTIQTAAQNVEKGDYVIAFVPGAKLNGIELKSKEMGGILSEGMLSSLSELGFEEALLNDKQKENVITFKSKINLNDDPINYFCLNDNLIEVSILSNRSDAQSYEIFAKELSAYFKTKQKNFFQEKKKKTFNSEVELKSNEENHLYGVEIQINNFKLNFNDYLLLLKSKIKIENDDFANFANLVLINTGVSLRSIDLKNIKSKQIKINEDNNIHYLTSNKEKISILGIEVVEKFKTNENSQNVLFEFSQINEKIVRENSKNSKKITLSSINNSRFVSYGCILLTYQFIQNYFANCSNLINKKEVKKIKIKYNYEYVKKYAGHDIKKDISYKHAINSLKILGFEFDKNKNLSIPLYRHDIKNMQGIVEEIFRFYGLNNFEPKEPKLSNFINDNILYLEKIISSLGYSQAWTYTLINKDKNVFNPFNFSKTFNLKTFVSEEFNSIRNSIALPLLNVYKYNIKRKIDNLSLFDIGMINDKKSIIISSNKKTFLEIKNDIQKIANQKFVVKKLNDKQLHPNYNAGLYLSGKLVGWIGKFNPHFLDSNVIFAEILEECLYLPKNVYIDYEQSPLKERDITISIEKEYEHAMYLDKFNSIEGIYSIELISSFEKSKQINLTYRIKMNDKALAIFEKIDWENKEEIINF